MKNEPTHTFSYKEALDKHSSFIARHLHDDVRALALQADRYAEEDIAFCLQQIAGRQQAARKLPTLALDGSIVFPPKVNLEQCSGEHTARYKADLFARIWQETLSEYKSPTAQDNTTHGGDEPQLRFLDATGGFGIDFAYIARRLKQLAGTIPFEAHYADTDGELCRITAHNLPLLNLPDALIHHSDGIDVLRRLAQSSSSVGQHLLLYIDPSRRDANGRRTYELDDCQPDVAALHDVISRSASAWVVKLSPMFDWHEAIRRLPSAREVHIVSTDGECKELLLVLSARGDTPLKVVCVNDEQVFAYYPQHPSPPHPSPSGTDALELIDGFRHAGVENMPASLFLYEPNASVMKAGCFAEVAQAFGIAPISGLSHLFLSHKMTPHFVGRTFRVEAVSSMNRSALRNALNGVDRANVAVRHFPMSAEALRRRLRINDGGGHYIFGTTTASGEHIVILARKAD